MGVRAGAAPATSGRYTKSVDHEGRKTWIYRAVTKPRCRGPRSRSISFRSAIL